MRRLATIRVVSEITPMDADQIESIRIDGWICVSKKGEFKVGDSCVYFEVDSYLPIEERYEFLRKSSYRKIEGLEGARSEGFRLKTIRMRGVLSQGLALPLNAFPELAGMELDRDVTAILRIETWDPPMPAALRGVMKGNFPSFLRKTDEERIQNHPEYLEMYRDEPWEISEKIDGSSCTMYLHEGTFGVCGRNWELKDTENNSYWNAARIYAIEDKLRAAKRNISLQGELAGEGIQGNPLRVKGQKFFLFNIFDIDTQKYLTPSQRDTFRLQYLYDLPICPRDPPNIPDPYILRRGMSEIIAMADGPSQVNPQRAREGLVCKSMQLIDGRVVSFKILSNAVLLKDKE
jgi:RNA ligase (TIGR02306 family)